MSALSRRQVFLSGGALGAVLAVPAAAPAIDGADAALIASCTEYERVASRQRALIAAIPNDVSYEDERVTLTAHINPLYGVLRNIEDGVIDTEATSLAGLAARAKALVASEPFMATPWGEECNGSGDAIARAIIRDLAAITGRAA